MATTPARRVDDNVTAIAEIVTFDEAENAVGDVPVSRVSRDHSGVHAARDLLISVGGALYPQLDNGAIAGWIYLNLDNDAVDQIISQNWVIVSMRAEGRYSVDFDAAWLANGCSPEESISEVTTGSGIIGPGVAETRATRPRTSTRNPQLIAVNGKAAGIQPPFSF
jgi:hypothetical protein